MARTPIRLAGGALLICALAAAGCHKHLLQPPPVTLPPAPQPCCPRLSEIPVNEPPPPAFYPIDLPTALRLTHVANPDIAVARERIREAQALEDRAEVLWLPTFEFGPQYVRHDGQIQQSDGDIITTSRSSLAVMGGPTLSFDTNEALFAPLAARQLTAARRAGAAAVDNERLADVASAYFDYLQVLAELRINEETIANARQLLTLTETYEKSGKGAPADTARARTEVHIRERERLELVGRKGVTQARLVQLLNLPPETELQPLEAAVVPVTVVPERLPPAELVAQGLLNRPELAENRALIEVALANWRSAKVAPFVPDLRLSYAGGVFGGGRNSFMGDFSGRGDFTAQAVWQLDQMGLGTAATIRQRQSLFNQANLRHAALQARVTQEVLAADSQTRARRQELNAAQEAVKAARESYRLNELRIRRAPEQGRPIELLQAIQALAQARVSYLQTVADYDRLQFRLYAALGHPPLCALDEAARVPTEEPTVPPAPATR